MRKNPARYAPAMHEIAVLAVDSVVAFDLSIPAQIFGHRDERHRYRLTVCAEQAGPVADLDRLRDRRRRGPRGCSGAPTP